MPGDPEKFEVMTSKEASAAALGASAGLVASLALVRSPEKVANDLATSGEYLFKYAVPLVSAPKDYVAKVDQKVSSLPSPHQVEGFFALPVLGVALFAAMTNIVRRRKFRNNLAATRRLNMELEIDNFSRELDAWGVDTKKH